MGAQIIKQFLSGLYAKERTFGLVYPRLMEASRAGLGLFNGRRKCVTLLLYIIALTATIKPHVTNLAGIFRRYFSKSPIGTNDLPSMLTSNSLNRAYSVFR